MDSSNGYNDIANDFAAIRSKGHIGVSSVREWMRNTTRNSAVLDLGCGTGIPISKALIEEGMNVFAIDASPLLVNMFRENFPGVPVACEAAEDSSFFNRKFDGIVAWGLIFLMPKDTQIRVIQKAADALKTGGKFLFTAPLQQTEWNDVLTGMLSRSLGTDGYREILTASGLALIEEFEDEGENHYYNALKV